MTNDELLHKWVNGTLSAEEEAVFRRRPEYESLTQLYRMTEGLEPPAFDGEAVLANILVQEKTALKPPVAAKKRPLGRWVQMAVAASVILLVGVWLWTSRDQTVTFEVASSAQTEGVLPDASTFVLNAESSLKYDKSTWEEARSLTLTGEAFFEVEKGADFAVKTPSGTVTVLGTKFNVRSRGTTLEVACQEGRVAVANVKGEILAELTPNEAIRLEAGKAVDNWQVPAANKASWVDGISKFRKVALSVVLEELERQFGVKIDCSKVNTEEVLSCNFQHKDLDLALQTVLSPLEIQYEVEGKRVKLRKE